MLNALIFIIGLVAIIKGADWLTDGAAAIALRFGIPTIVVGLTIVAIGSSMPEFVVSAISAAQGQVDLALGNVVGSNIFNILAIMGITAMVRPVRVEQENVRYDVPFAVLSSIAVAAPALLPGSSGICEISRADGVLMLLMFAIFISYTLAIARKAESEKPTEEKEDDIPSAAEAKIWKSILCIIVGLTLLLLGGQMLVMGATGIALALGISQSVVALTVVSIGTSAPELAASVMAARKGDTAMALGNVIGSVVFNVFYVLGTAAIIHPLSIGGVTAIDITVLLVASILLWIFCKFGKTYYTLTRMEGAVLLAMMIAYYIFLIEN